VNVEASDVPLKDVEDSIAHGFIELARKHWLSQLPGDLTYFRLGGFLECL
jgi:hypothetical protein